MRCTEPGTGGWRRRAALLVVSFVAAASSSLLISFGAHAGITACDVRSAMVLGVIVASGAQVGQTVGDLSTRHPSRAAVVALLALLTAWLLAVVLFELWVHRLHWW